MQTDSSASSTCFRFASAVECAATVLMPSSRQARSMRSAISPRLAMTIFSSIGVFFFGDRPVSESCSLDDEQRLTELDRLAVLDHDGLDLARLLRLDLVHHLHGLDDAQYLSDLDRIAQLDELLGTRCRRGVIGAHHRGSHDMFTDSGAQRA